MDKPPHPSRHVIWLAFWLLFLLHQDVWFWSDRTLVLGVVPIGLAYHVGYSFAAATLWYAATRWAWPSEIEDWAEMPTTSATEGPRS